MNRLEFSQFMEPQSWSHLGRSSSRWSWRDLVGGVQIAGGGHIEDNVTVGMIFRSSSTV